MVETQEARDDSAFADTTMRAWVGREAEDVPPGWMDNVVRRLLAQVNRELIKLEGTDMEKEPNDPATRDQSSQTLHRLELTLGRLIKLETQRAALRTGKASSNEGALEKFKRKLDALVVAAGQRAPEGANE